MKVFFVWTIGDLVGLCFIGLLALLGMCMGGLVLWEKLTRKIKGWFKRTA